MLSPLVYGLSGARGAAWLTPFVIGLLILAMAAFTRSETGLIKLIPMRIHLIVEAALGLTLALAPFMVGYSSMPPLAWVHSFLVGVALLEAALLTQWVTGEERTSAES